MQGVRETTAPKPLGLGLSSGPDADAVDTASVESKPYCGPDSSEDLATPPGDTSPDS